MDEDTLTIDETDTNTAGPAGDATPSSKSYPEDVQVCSFAKKYFNKVIGLFCLVVVVMFDRAKNDDHRKVEFS